LALGIHSPHTLSPSLGSALFVCRLDLQECLDIAAKGKVKAHIQKKPLDDINDVLDRMKKGQLEGRIVLSLL